MAEEDSQLDRMAEGLIQQVLEESTAVLPVVVDAEIVSEVAES